MGSGERPVRFVRRGRYLSARQRWWFRLYRMRTGNVLFAADGELVFALVAYGVRVATLPLVAVTDLVVQPVLRWMDRDDRSWSRCVSTVGTLSSFASPKLGAVRRPRRS